MLFYSLVRGCEIALILTLRALSLTTFFIGAISPRTHREILAYFRQDAAMRIRTPLAILLAFSLFATFSISAPAFAATKKPIPATSPKPVWPPPGFKENNGVYAKVPSTTELVGLLSAKRSLQEILEQCKITACGAVFVASERGCTWWEVNSVVRKVNDSTRLREQIGRLVTHAKGTSSRVQSTIFLLSPEPVDPRVSIGNIRVICHRETSNIPKPGNTYTPIVAADN